MWQPVSFTPLASIADIGQSLAPDLAALQGAIRAGSDALGGLGLPGTPAPSDLPDLTGRIGELFDAPAHYLALTPYMEGIGERKGDQAFLTPSEAIRITGERLMDQAGAFVKDVVSGAMPDTALVFILFAAPEPGQLAQSLAAFNSVFPITELEQAQRRAGALATLDLDKFIIPKAPAFPLWGMSQPGRNPLGQDMNKLIASQASQAKTVAELTQSPLERLARFAQKQQAAITEKQAQLGAITGKLAGSDPGWFGIYLEGLVTALIPLLAQFTPPLPDTFKCCSTLCWYGKKNEVAYYKEAFGLANPLEGILP